ncbi:MAG: hypothetical protein AUJ47_02840 [Candidatus Marinimicrobia bacterium CG1_02_48_14]|nr:MAG: hypothetical protein AUJ47_02840 [Candidatus Marinimicrobia bacterium CG1_02_48_14]
MQAPYQNDKICHDKLKIIRISVSPMSGIVSVTYCLQIMIIETKRKPGWSRQNRAETWLRL